MLKLNKVAVTGGISCGKSLFCKYLSEFGAYVIDSDQIVHHLLNPETELGHEVIKLFGSSVVVDRIIDRTRVAKKAFLNPRLLKSLENLLHPPVYEEINCQYEEICKQKIPPPLFVAEVPLLFESNGDQYFDTTIAVIADRETCWQRYRAKTGHEREDFNRRGARQLNQHEKAERAEYVIHNNETIEELKKETKKLFDSLAK